MTKVIDGYQCRAGPRSMDDAEEKERPSVWMALRNEQLASWGCIKETKATG